MADPTAESKEAHPSSQPAPSVAWLSLDERDNDPTRFLTYLVAALQTLALSDVEGIAAGIGAGVLAALQAPQPPPAEALLTVLINEITTVPESFVLVLDDYHLIEAKPVDDALAFLVEHLPPQMHLVIATREDPQLPLARLRGRGQLTELRAADLRFTPSEAAEFLNRAMGLNLSAEDIAALEARTEGWIAGLQLAPCFAGDDLNAGSRFARHHRLHQVVHRQPPFRAGLSGGGGPGTAARKHPDFLLRTPILDRLCGPLCDAVLRRLLLLPDRKPPVRRPYNISNAPTCSSSLWTTSGIGTAITISLPNCCDSG